MKTVLCYFNTHWSHSYVSAPREMIQFLPLLCYFENETTDEELKRDCHWQFLNGLARSLIRPEDAEYLFDAIVKVSVALIFWSLTSDQEFVKESFQASNNKWWKARVSTLQFLRVALFSNLFYFWTNEFKDRIFTLLAQLLQDPQLEVREMASDTLGGLLHCRFIAVDQDLMVSNGRVVLWHMGTWVPRLPILVRTDSVGNLLTRLDGPFKSHTLGHIWQLHLISMRAAVFGKNLWPLHTVFFFRKNSKNGQQAKLRWHVTRVFWDWLLWWNRVHIRYRNFYPTSWWRCVRMRTTSNNLFKRAWRKRCRNSKEPITIAGKNIKSSSPMINWPFWPIYWYHPIIMCEHILNGVQVFKNQFYFWFFSSSSSRVWIVVSKLFWKRVKRSIDFLKIGCLISGDWKTSRKISLKLGLSVCVCVLELV